MVVYAPPSRAENSKTVCVTKNCLANQNIFWVAGVNTTITNIKFENILRSFFGKCQHLKLRKNANGFVYKLALDLCGLNSIFMDYIYSKLCLKLRHMILSLLFYSGKKVKK